MPTTPLGALIVPNTGDLPGSWGTAALNPNFTVIDAVARGVQSFSLAAATTFTLTAPSGSITPGAGPTQSQNAVLKFTGTLSGNANITLPLPGYYIVINNCVVGSSNFVRFRAVGTGAIIGLPPGQPIQVYCDGTDVGFVGLEMVGKIVDTSFAASPQWMNACTVLPYLPCDGTVYNVSSYVALGAVLGSTFGGNGATTFGVPDLRGRYRIPVDSTGTRITSAGAGFDGATLGAQGGNQFLSAHTHTNTLTDPSHFHAFATATLGAVAQGNTDTALKNGASGNTSPNTTGISINNAAAGSGGSGNIPPAQVVGVAFIKT